jgi:dihydropteroate synthase
MGAWQGPDRLPASLSSLRRPLVMGVVNVTPDSFSDGGAWLDPDAALARGIALREQGADLVDVGGESTRPGAERVAVDDELRRVLPVVAGLADAGVAVSIDTMRARTAAEAVAAGAVLVNDVSGGLADEAMLPAVAELGTAYVAMHWRGHSRHMAERAVYDDVVAEVRDHLVRRLAAAVAAGVAAERVVLDPGLGFAKRAAHDWALLHSLETLVGLGRPVLVGPSRKRFLGAVLAGAGEPPPTLAARDDATAAVCALSAAAGAWCVRVHDPRSAQAAVRVGAAWRAGGV